MFSLPRHHHHRQKLFLGIAAAALLLTQAVFVYKAFAQLLTDAPLLTAAIVLPAPNTVITSGEVVLLQASVNGATQGTTVGFLVSGSSTPRTLPGVAMDTAITAPTSILYEAAMPISAADNGAYTVQAIVSDAATGRNVQSDSLPFSIAFPTTLTQASPAVTLTAPAAGTYTGPFDLRAEVTVPASSLHFAFSVSGSTAPLSYEASSTDGLTWTGSVDAAHALPVGTYDLRAIAVVNGTKVESSSRSITIATATSTNTTTTAEPFEILRVAPESGRTFASGPITIQVVTNQPTGHVSATVMNPAAVSSSAKLSSFVPSADGMTWTASWFPEDAPNGTYTVTFVAVREGVERTQTSVFTLQRTVATTDTVQAEVPTVAWASPTASQSTVSGSVGLRLTTTGTPESAKFVVRGGPNAIEQAIAATSAGSGAFTASWDTTTVPNGTYAVRGTAKKGTLTVATIDERIFVVQNGTAVVTEDGTTEDTAEIVPATPFTVAFVAPAAGATVSGEVATALTTSLVAKSVQGYVSGASATASPTAVELSMTYDAGKGQWVASWRTDGLNAGDYRISVIATSLEGRTADAVIVVKVPAPVTAPQPVAELPRIAVVITEPKGGTITGGIRLGATSEGSPETVTFLIRSTAPGSTEITRKATSSGTQQWSAFLAEGSLAPGTYIMVASAAKAGSTATSAPVQFTIASAVSTPVVTQLPEDERPLEVALVAPDGGVLRGVVRFMATTNLFAQSVRFLVFASGSGVEVAAFDAAYQTATASWVAIRDTTAFPDGTYQIVASGMRSGQSARSAMVTVTIENASGTMRLQTEFPVEAVRQSVLELPAGTSAIDADKPTVPQTPRATEEAEQRIAGDCAERDIPADKCQDWLAGQPQTRECKALGITTGEECLNWLKRLAGGELLECRGVSDARCAEAEQRKTAGLLSGDQLERIDAAITDHLNTVITLTTDAGTKRAEAVSVTAPEKPVDAEFSDLIPLRPTEQGGKIALRVHASPSYVRISETESARRVPAVLLLDADEDGLPDDVERRLGSDPWDADSDDDGFDDGTEIRNGFDPLGPGKIGADHGPIAPFDAAIIAGLPIEQPTEAGAVSEGLGIDFVGSSEDEAGIRFAGTGTPGEIVSIFVYSYLPVVLSTTVAEDGTWAYDLDDTLADGRHEAYVTVTDSTGKIAKKGNPLSFFVAEAKAVTEEGYFGENADLVAVAEAPVMELYRYYTIGAIALVLVAALLGVMIFRQPKREVMTE